MSQPIRTATSKQIIEALDEQRHKADLNTDGEMHTSERRYWTGQRDAIDFVTKLVRSLLPYVEVDSVQRAMPGVFLTEAEFLLGDPAVSDQVDEASDPTLPFVLA